MSSMDTTHPLLQRFAVPIAVLIIIGFVGAAVFEKKPAVDPGFIAPSTGTAIPVSWGDLGKQLVDSGVIDENQLAALYGKLSPEQRGFLSATTSSDIVVTPENASYLLNLLWALGLGNKNPILADEMMDPRYGGAGRFASTGGWTIAKGDPMNHYNKHAFITLTVAQQKLVDDVSENIYRPCCDNPTHFPDCNHGMAMLGLLELMASQGKNEDEMYRAALTMNSYWFPSQYQTLASYFASKGENWKEISAKEVLGKEYSSASGYARIAAIMQPKQPSGGSCSV
jgi:hypothetical protein